MNKYELFAIIQEAREKYEVPDLHGANLERVNLERVNLEWVNLCGANLCGANLRGANLQMANLDGANLHGANLQMADLQMADLEGANLCGANLQMANLKGANLRRANLYWANLEEVRFDGANLSGTCLDPLAPIPPVSDETLLEAGFELRDGYVYGWRTKFSQHYGNAEYESGKTYTATVFSVSGNGCHPGIYLAGKDWLEGAYPGKPLVRCRCNREDIHKVGDKFRCRKLEVL